MKAVWQQMQGGGIFVAAFLIVCGGALFGPAAQAEEHKAGVVIGQIRESPLQERIRPGIQELYDRIGIEAEFMLLPSKRALVMTNAGELDAEIFRVAKAARRYPNLRRVPTEVTEFTGRAFFIKDLQVDSWDALEGLRVGIVHGAVWAEEGTRGRKVVRTETLFRLLERLVNGSVDVAISTHGSVMTMIETSYPDKGIKYGAPLNRTPVYHYVHKDLEYLVPKLDQVIREMKREGVFDRLTGPL
ncbi:substrate-binding periplasmic protein [Sneathiella chinensis]|uniref:ABC transporter substrate-binding protein n=2 Tax=Sneathiella chinensis TaxID=349750 RepID=A0ABQ5U5L4_9PROT|nr:transporter substrate-binding domain-containing protein [Sneathiella chinensis]GLQ07003.1 ABC transporter substrate-binding protein [Sneathiella chinensis]